MNNGSRSERGFVQEARRIAGAYGLHEGNIDVEVRLLLRMGLLAIVIALGGLLTLWLGVDQRLVAGVASVALGGLAVFTAIRFARLLWTIRAIDRQLPAAREHVLFIAAIAAGGLLLPAVIVFSLVFHNTGAALWLMLVYGLVVIASLAGLLMVPAGLRRFVITGNLLITLLLATAAVAMPRTSAALRWRSTVADLELGQQIAPAIDEVQIHDPRDLTFVSATGEPALFGAQVDGEWRLARVPGYHKSGAALRPLVSEADRRSVTDWVAARAAVKVDTERRAREESDRIAAQTAREAAERAEREAAEARARADREAVEAERRRVEQLEQAEVRFREAHVRPTGHINDAGSLSVAVFISAGKAAGAEEITNALLARFTAAGARASSDLFTPINLTDGSFDSLFRSDADLIKRLKLEEAVDCMALGQLVPDVHPVSRAGTTEVGLTLSVRIISTRDARVLQRFTASGRGVALNEGVAHKHARDDLIADIQKQAAEKFSM